MCFGEFLVFRSLRNCLDGIIINCKKFHDFFKRKKHSNQRELGKFIILSYSYNEATVNKHKLTVKRMSDLLPASFLYGIIQDKIV